MKKSNKIIGIAIVLIIIFSYWGLIDTNKSYATDNKLIIALDPGHGGGQPGAVNGSIMEKDLTLKVANFIKQYLSEYENVEVGLTHNGLPSDQELEIFDRGVYARKINADVIISLHFNSSTSNSVKGAEIYATNCDALPKYKKEMTELGNKVLKKLSDLGLQNRGVRYRTCGDATDEYYPGCRADYDGPIRYAMRGTMIDDGKTYVLENGEKVEVDASKSADVKNGEGVPGILIEHCYIKGDEDFIDSEEDIRKLAKADADAIVEQYGLKKKNNTGIEINETKKIFLIEPQIGMKDIFEKYSDIKVKDLNGNLCDKSALIKTGFSIIKGNSTYQCVKLGDVNGDGTVDARDSLRILRYVAGLTEVKESYLEAIDTNCDGKFDARDSLRILNFIVGKSKISL